MNTKELDSFRLSDAISFHNNLNPKLWKGNKLLPIVKDQLNTIAKDFLEELGIHDLDVRDITISGSNAAYTYTPHSDLDLHILVNMADLPQSEVYKELFNAKKTIYNDTHDITVHGVPVELYVQDANEPVKSLGEYSLMNDKWLRIPTKRRANFDQTATKAKYEKLLELVKTALKTKDSTKLDKILKKIKQYRQAGLDKGGEFGPENLAYKALRSQGYITKLYDLRDKLHSERLSIEGMYAQEDYHPNAKPRGPEFKPTMPKGTVRVDVSDVYDWYKLGQHISNMKGLGKHDFGKGPPSTILSFGDEDTEHKYIQDLEKTGLTTTDIDPVDPNQPKGMKRQKVDPTFNVNEEGVAEGQFDSLVKTDQAERNAYRKFVADRAGGDWSRGARLYAKLKNRPADDIFGDDARLQQFMRIKFDFENFTKHDWRNFWLLSQHADKYTGFQKQALDAIEKHLGQDNDYYRYLADRISCARTGQQKYGTQDMCDQQGVAESFDQPYKLKWEKSEHGDYDALATLDDGTYLSIMFNNEFKKNWMVEFYRNNSQSVTGEGDAQRIFATVLTAIKQFITKKKPQSLFFSAVKEDDPTGSRTKLYDRLVQRYASNLGYNIQKQEHPGQMAYKLTRISNVKESASGYIPSNAQKDDPRFKTGLSVDVKPDSIKKNAKAFSWLTSRAGIPPTAKTNGKF